jgi:hypothetical protein
MPALAHEPARLIGPFHFGSPSLASSCGGSAIIRRGGHPQSPAGASVRGPTGRRSEFAVLIGLGAGSSQSEAQWRLTCLNLAETINSFRFLSRVLDSFSKYRCQRVL